MADEDTRQTGEAKAVLIEQANALGLKVHHKWSVDTLAEKVLEAQEAKKAAETADAKAHAKVWVYLLRDAFPVEDEKHVAGETIQVTPETADYWYEAGVCRPGKAPAVE